LAFQTSSEKPKLRFDRPAWPQFESEPGQATQSPVNPGYESRL
jgi:hypothetical protein